MSYHRRAQPRKTVRFQQGYLIALVVLFVCISLMNRLWQIQDESMRIWFFDIGQGDATLIETPHGQQILIDGGPNQAILSKLSSVMWPWDRTLDGIVVTHPDADHITGLIPVFEQYQVETIYETGVRGGTSVIAELVEAMETEQANHLMVHAGQSFEIDGVILDIVWPTTQAALEQKNRNDTSVVIRVRYGKTVVLLTGDAEAGVEENFFKDVGDVDVLKVGHHGSQTSTSVKLLREIRPEVAVISSGFENKYGHPHAIILSRLLEIGAQVWRTDLDGDVVLSSNGTSFEVKPAFLPF